MAETDENLDVRKPWNLLIYFHSDEVLIHVYVYIYKLLITHQFNLESVTLRPLIFLNIGSENGLLPDSTKPFLELIFTYHQKGPATFIWGQFYKKHLCHQ